MKKLSIVFFVLLLAPKLVVGIDFAPVILELSAPDAINYAFDGSELSIPVTVLI